MTVQDALRMYNIPFTVSAITQSTGYTSYQLIPQGAQATPENLQRKISALTIAICKELEIVTENNCLFLRVKEGGQPVYDWYNYAGHLDFKNPEIPFMVGFTPQGQLITDTIKHCPHLLVSGTTGSGKTIFLHTLIASCKYNHTNTFLVDCKQEEFCIYEDVSEVAYTAFGQKSGAIFLNYLIDLMEKRNESKRLEGFRDFESWQAVDPDNRRRCILVIDELADLLSDRKAQQTLLPRILRIAQKGRSAGIHLVLATQRPDANVINGTIKANIPTRLAFHAITNTDSRVVLDCGGAEKLAGNGDGLYLSNGSSRIQRVQAPYIDVNRIKQDMKKSA